MNACLSASAASSAGAVQWQPGVSGQPVQQIRFGAVLPHRQRHRDGVLLDHLVCRFAAHAGAHRRDQDPGGGEERQEAVEFTLNHRGVGAELVEHRQERLGLPVDGEERVGQRHAPHHRAEHVALVPLRAGQFGSHRRIAAQHHLQSVHALTRRVFILCGMADEPTCPGAKPSVTSSWPAISRMVCASDDGPAPTCTSADTTSWSSDRG